MLRIDVMTTTRLQGVEQVTSKPGLHVTVTVSFPNSYGAVVLNAYNLSSRKLEINGRIAVWTACIGNIHEMIGHPFLIHQEKECSMTIIAGLVHRKPGNGSGRRPLQKSFLNDVQLMNNVCIMYMMR